jgi:hypothetical protein
MTVFQAPIGATEEIAVKLANSTVTTVVEGTDEDGAWYVPWVQCNEDAGGTPSLTLDLYDGTTAYVLGAGGVTYNAKALTAGQSVTFSEGIHVPVGWSLRAKSSDAAGKITIVGTKARRLG